MSSEMEVHQEAAPVAAPRVQPPRAKTDDWALVIRPVSNLAEQVAGTEFVPAALRGKPAAVAAAILFGRELDMPPMQALQQVHVIDGRPSLSAEHKRAMVLEKGHMLTVVGDGGSATATGRRLLAYNPATGEPVYGQPSTVTWTLAMAAQAGLTGKNNWKRHPRQMLKARATAELINDLFADITHGLATREELEDEDSIPASTPPPASEKVSRKPSKRVASAPAVGVGAAETPAPAATPALESVAIPEVPLPGEDESVGETPGEGLTAHSEPTDSPDSAGDGSLDDVAATGSDASYMETRFREAQDAAGGPVPENDPPMSPGATRALAAAFTSLGIRDDGERHHTTSALLGRKITSWKELTRHDGERLFLLVQDLKTREELEVLVQRAAREWEAQP